MARTLITYKNVKGEYEVKIEEKYLGRVSEEEALIETKSLSILLKTLSAG